MWVYINYPNPHFGVHRDHSCRMIRMRGKPDQRVRTVSIYTLGDALSEFIDEEMRFAAEGGLNDLWIKIHLDTPEQEMGLVHVLQAILGKRYSPLSNASVDIHC